LSAEPEAKRLPSGEWTTQRTRSPWPQQVRMGLPVRASLTRTAASLAGATASPPGANETERTGPAGPARATRWEWQGFQR